MLYSALIIDNETRAITNLSKELSNRKLQDFKYPIRTAPSKSEALKMMLQFHKVLDVVFLDLDLDDSAEGRKDVDEYPSGLILLKEFRDLMRKEDENFKIPFSVIIVTHYEQLHGAVANLFHEFPCLLAIVSKSTYMGKSFEDQLDDALKGLLKTMVQTGNYLVQQTYKDSLQVIPFHEILYIEAADSGSGISNTKAFIWMKNGEKIETNRQLKTFEEQGYRFFYRCHKQFIVNLNHVIEINPNGKGRGNPSITVSNGAEVKVSRTRKNELINLCRTLRINPSSNNNELK